MAEKLTSEFGSQTVLDLLHFQEHRHLNQEPGFQRKTKAARPRGRRRTGRP